MSSDPSLGTVLGVLVLGALLTFLAIGPFAILIAYAVDIDMLRTVAVAGAVSWCVGSVFAFFSIESGK